MFSILASVSKKVLFQLGFVSRTVEGMGGDVLVVLGASPMLQLGAVSEHSDSLCE